ncbi:Phosphopantetheine adenylyltransferase [bioreactor metagenome]|uniref:Phosphopantetheine adenylyltransferase n=1 Tax=bioreactor metagenome TaxID=1076179 RepID=A0A644ZJU5_9ZZZZ
MIIAVYPGSFDPFTLGHLNIVKRAAVAFDKVIVCVMVNSQKSGMFTPEERVEMITRVVRDIPNVEVDCSKELVAEYARRRGARILVKGLRVISDYEAEMQMAMVNNKLNPDLDTLFFPSSEKYTYISSTVVKEMMRYGIDLNEFIPREMVEDVKRKMCAKRRE